MSEKFETTIKKRLSKYSLGKWKQTHDGGLASPGYKPDRVYQKASRRIIVEIEASTSRKGFLGGYLKAQKFLESKSSSRNSALLFLQKGERTSVDSIRNQVVEYHEWLRDSGIPVRPVYLMDVKELFRMPLRKTELFSRDFFSFSVAVR